jgi:serine/threonine protein kinase
MAYNASIGSPEGDWSPGSSPTPSCPTAAYAEPSPASATAAKQGKPGMRLASEATRPARVGAARFVPRRRRNRGNLLSVVLASMPEELQPGFEFGGYVIGECIGRGGMARVYRAEHTTLHKAVALKVLDTWVVEKPGGRERFLREARTAAAIKHPNVVEIMDLGVLGERPYIVMELLDGCDLESELERRGALSDTEVASVALPVIAGLMAVHEAGVVHRDIKPSNIFLAKGADGEIIPKVLDFGISKFSDSLLEPLQGLTNTREIVGTPTYMAPEALNGARGLGPHADQYALGAVLYDCSVGRPPFEGETLLELLKAIAIGDVLPPRTIRPEMSPILESAILRAMNADPSARFETLRDLGIALWPLGDERTQSIWSRSFGNGVSPRSTRLMGGPATLPQRAASPPKRARRWAVGLGAVAVLGALSGLAWYWTRSSLSPAVAVRSSGAVPALSPTEPQERGGATVETRSLLAAAPNAAGEPGSAGASAITGSGTTTGGVTVKPADTADGAKPGARARAERSDALTARGKLASRDDTDGARKRSVRRAAAAENAGRGRHPSEGEDGDLDQMFLPTGARDGQLPASDADTDLRALFPANSGKQATANGAPLTD